MAIWRRNVRGKRQTDYTASFSFRRKLYRKSGFIDRENAKHWVDSTRSNLRRGEAVIVHARKSQQVIPLIDLYTDYLLGPAKKCSAMYVYTAGKRLRKMSAEIPWMTLSDFTAINFEDWRKSGPKWKGHAIKDVTLNQYLDIALEFGNWLVKKAKQLPLNPMLAVDRLEAKKNDAYRRAASTQELEKLLEAAPPERALVYRFLIYLPLRRGALKEILWSDFLLDGKNPTFTLRPEISKSGHAARLAVPSWVVKSLKKQRGDAAAADRVFAALPTIDELKKDLEAAGVAFNDGTGGRGNRRLDLHAFRKTAIRLLKQAGVSLDEAHVFLQHKTRQTTERYYDDDRVAPEISRAAEKMPKIGGK